jgi:hypothetical protein
VLVDARPAQYQLAALQLHPFLVLLSCRHASYLPVEVVGRALLTPAGNGWQAVGWQGFAGMSQRDKPLTRGAGSEAIGDPLYL